MNTESTKKKQKPGLFSAYSHDEFQRVASTDAKESDYHFPLPIEALLLVLSISNNFKGNVERAGNSVFFLHIISFPIIRVQPNVIMPQIQRTQDCMISFNIKSFRINYMPFWIKFLPLVYLSVPYQWNWECFFSLSPSQVTKNVLQSFFILFY